MGKKSPAISPETHSAPTGSGNLAGFGKTPIAYLKNPIFPKIHFGEESWQTIVPFLSSLSKNWSAV